MKNSRWNRIGMGGVFLLLACSAENPTAESNAALQGEVEVRIANLGDRAEAQHFLSVNGGELVALHFSAPPELVTGDTIRVHGEAAEPGVFEVSSFERVNEPGVAQQELVDPAVLRRPKMALLLVNWTAPDSVTVDSATSSLITGTSSARAHYLESSYGQQELSGAVFGWYKIAAPNGCDMNQVRDSALAAAAAAGVDLTTYSQVGIYFPRFTTCGWSGLGQVGSPTRPAKYTWYNGSIGSVLVHELGHNFGLYHSRSYDCGTAPIGDRATCTITEYGDPFDPMGNGRYKHFNGYSKYIEGWFGGCNVVSAPQGGSFDIAPIAVESNGVQMVRVPMSPSLCPSVNGTPLASCEYMIEYRQPIGFDAGANGVLIYANSATTRTYPSLLDMTPTTNSFGDGALAVGKTFTDPSGVSISVLGADATKATVRVQVPAPAGTNTCLNGTAYTGTGTPPPPPPPPPPPSSYTIRNVTSAKCADIYGASTTDGADAIQWTCNGGNNQKWKVVDVTGGGKQVVAVHSNKCLTITGGSTADGVFAEQFPCVATQAYQQWSLTDTGSGRYTIKALHSNKCLTVTGASTADGARLQQATCTGANSQLFTLTAAN